MATIDRATLDGIHLSPGKHARPQEGMCLMEAIAWLAGEPFSDHPACVSPTLAAFGRTLNDSALFAGHRDDLLPLIPRLVGTTAPPEVERRRRFLLADWAVREIAPLALDAAGLAEQAATLRALPAVVDAGSAAAARAAAADAAAARAADAAADAAAAARAAADAARAAADADAAYADADAADAAAYAADAAAAAGAADADLRARAIAVVERAIALVA